MPTPNLISLDQAIEMTGTFRTQKENILAEEHQDSGMLPVCETFGREAFDILLRNDRCAGIRIYSSMGMDLKIRFIIVGVDSEDNNIYIQADPAEPANKSVIEAGIRCPDNCPRASELNR